MKPSSAKQKGRILQNWVRDRIIQIFSPLLTDQDVRSTSSGANGEDVLLSSVARKLFPFSVECKNLASIAAYTWYEQAQKNASEYEPLLIIKANRKKPLAVVDAEFFFDMIGKNYGTNKEPEESKKVVVSNISSSRRPQVRY